MAIRRPPMAQGAHLHDERGFSPPVHRFSATPELQDAVRGYWLPVWSLPPGEASVQRVLQYPVLQVVIGHDYAHLVGPRRGLSTVELRGSGWVLGAMLQPAVGAHLWPRGVAELVDATVPLAHSALIDVPTLAAHVRGLLAESPDDPTAQLAAVAALERYLVATLPAMDADGMLVNQIVDFVETHEELQRVGQVREKFGLTERRLQRLVSRRTGLTPKWLIQRRRLHTAASRLVAEPGVSLARVAADVGYADQAHFSRDFRAVTGLRPAEYAAQRAGG